jgi:cytochrome c
MLMMKRIKKFSAYTLSRFASSLWNAILSMNFISWFVSACHYQRHLRYQPTFCHWHVGNFIRQGNELLSPATSLVLAEISAGTNVRCNDCPINIWSHFTDRPTISVD